MDKEFVGSVIRDKDRIGIYVCLIQIWDAD